MSSRGRPSPLGHRRFRILVVEDEPEVQGEALRQFVDDPDVELIINGSQEAAMSAIDERFIDAAVVDINLSDAESGGYDVLRQLARRAPTAPIVLATQYFDPAHVRDMVGFVGPDSRIVKIIDKAEPPSNWMRQALATELERWRRSHVVLVNAEILVDLLYDRASQARIPPLRPDRLEIEVEVDRLCRRMFGSVAVLADASEVEVALQPLAREGLSAAVTVEAEVRLGRDADGSAVPGSRCVLKVGERRDLEQEAVRYDQFVKYGVRLRQRVELLDKVSMHALGAVCYSFAGGVFGEDLVSLDELFGSPSRHEDARSAVKMLFESRNWYAVHGEPTSARVYIEDTYKTDFERCYRELDGTLDKLSRRLSVPYRHADETRDGSFEIRGQKLVIPRKNFRGRGWFISTSLETCLVHGDMHGGNVMLEVGASSDATDADERSAIQRVCLIDFGSAGPGPRAVDAVALQASLRLADAQVIAADTEGNDALRTPEERFREAIRTAAGRASKEREVLARAWDLGGPAENERAVDTGWEVLALDIARELRRSFKTMAPREYLAIALPCAIRQLGYRTGPVARVRVLAWLSAQYQALAAIEENR